MIVFPNCKINLGLHILNKREDGYHNLATVFYPVPLNDALELIRSQDQQPQEEISFQTTGLTIEGDQQNNLCIKAYKLLKKDFPQLPPVQMHLHKVIPMGAGLGGGSSDGAFALQLINQKFQLGISEQQLIDYALQLGSDCPFFIINKPVFATGRGELMTPVELNLSDYRFALINPQIHVNTGWAFSQLNLNSSGRMERPDLRSIIQQPIETWKNHLTNDFEEPVADKYPVITDIKQKLYDAGAVYASMTGSGSTVFGIFHKSIEPKICFPEEYYSKLIG
ncbi:MAG: 4-(cytidine 5'-diphospho)-2-C-methyl-D-erythritol kinase [Lacibacter sp.]